MATTTEPRPLSEATPQERALLDLAHATDVLSGMIFELELRIRALVEKVEAIAEREDWVDRFREDQASPSSGEYHELREL